VLHSLRIFFIDAFDRGDLSVKPPSPDSEEGQSAEAVFSAWLHRQYCAYQASLLRLLGHPEADARTQVGAWQYRQHSQRCCADASTPAVLAAASSRRTALLTPTNPPCPQVSAFMALMECVRGERPGVFNNQLFSQVLGVLLGSEGTAPEVLGLLIGRFLGGCRGGLAAPRRSVLLCAAMCCSVLGCAASCCSVLCCMRGGQGMQQAGGAPPRRSHLRLSCRQCFCRLLAAPLQSWQMYATSLWLASSG
jgi:hypothetical protein